MRECQRRRACACGRAGEKDGMRVGGRGWWRGQAQSVRAVQSREGAAGEFEKNARKLPFGFQKLRERPILGFETLREMSLALGVSESENLPTSHRHILGWNT